MKYTIKNRWATAAQCEVEIKCNANASEGVKLGLAVRAAVRADANLTGANLAGAYLAGSYFVGANLAGANLAGAYLTDANLTGANLADAYLAGSYFMGATLASANLAGSYFVGANFTDANLTDANLAGANLAGSYFVGANFTGANFTGAKWRDGITITRVPLQLYGLVYPVTILDTYMQIGCELHTFDEWNSFDDERIARMDGVNARRFWRDNKAALMLLCRSREVKAESKEEVAA